MYKYKKLNARSLSLLSAPALCMSSIFVAQAATLIPNAVYNMTVDPTSCFNFGDCIAVPLGPVTGVIQIETADDGASGVTFTVNSYEMDAYPNTAGGAFATFASGAYADHNAARAAGLFTGARSSGGDTSAMSGSVDAAGNIIYTPTGRQGGADLFSFLGIPLWNFDDNTARVPLASNADSFFTSGTSFNYTPDTPDTVELTLNGSILVDNGDGTSSARIVSVDNIGDAWGVFAGTPYSEVYDVTFSLVSANPYAVDDVEIAFEAPVTTTIQISDLLANDVHATGDTLTFEGTLSATTEAANGSTIVDNGDGTLTYNAPTLNLPFLTDSFDYTVQDEGGDTDIGTVTLFFPTGAPPIAVPDFPAAFDEDTAVTVDPIANDTDADGDVLVLFAFDGLSANGGVVTAAGGNSVTYTPAANFFGTDTFGYTVHDGNGNLVVGQVTLDITPVNDAPVCSDVSFITPQNTALDIDIGTDLLDTTATTPLCTDVEGDALTLGTFDTTSAEGGTISSNGAGILTYDPRTDFLGDDTFTFTASDGTDTAAPNTVTMDVANPNLGNFTMLNSDGNTFGGTNDVLFEWDRTSFNTDETDTTTNATMRSVAPPDGFPFFGSPWSAHHIRIFQPGTYRFDTTCNKTDFDSGVTDCNRPLGADQTQQYLEVTVGPGQIGAMVFFDYSVTEDIDVFLVWDQNAKWDRLGGTGTKNALFTGQAGVAPDPDTEWELVSTDGDGDGIVGVAMVDGPFLGFSANFNIGPGTFTPPPPPITGETPDTSLGKSSLSIWGLVAGLFALFGLRRFRSKK